MIVVDASTLVDVLLGRAAALDVLDATLGADVQQHLHAPELIEPEALNVLRRLAGHGQISVAAAAAAVADLADVRLIRYPHAPLRERVWELRDNLTAYDATYLALADALERSTLLTSDGGLAAVARDVLGEQRVCATA